MSKLGPSYSLLSMYFELGGSCDIYILGQETLSKREGSVRLISLYSLDKLIFILKILLTSVSKRATLRRRLSVPSIEI